MVTDMDFERFVLDNREHLTRLEQKVDALATAVHQIRSGDSMPRCVEEHAEIEKALAAGTAAHKRLDSLNAKAWWAFTTGAAAILAVVVGLFKDFITKGG